MVDLWKPRYTSHMPAPNSGRTVVCGSQYEGKLANGAHTIQSASMRQIDAGFCAWQTDNCAWLADASASYLPTRILPDTDNRSDGPASCLTLTTGPTVPHLLTIFISQILNRTSPLLQSVHHCRLADIHLAPLRNLLSASSQRYCFEESG